MGAKTIARLSHPLAPPPVKRPYRQLAVFGSPRAAWPIMGPQKARIHPPGAGKIREKHTNLSNSLKIQTRSLRVLCIGTPSKASRIRG